MPLLHLPLIYGSSDKFPQSFAVDAKLIVIRTFEGTTDDIATFTQRVWIAQFRSHTMVPVWERRYFDWQLMLEEPSERHLWVAAYEEDHLIGCLFAQPFRFRIFDETEFYGASSSWLTVDSKFRRQGVARSLAVEMLRRMRLDDCRFLLGFGMRGAGDQGTKFWSSLGENTVVGNTVYMWACPLAFDAVTRAAISSIERAGLPVLRIASRFRISADASGGVRDYDDSDLDACLSLLTDAGRTSELSYVWSRVKLAHQLRFQDFPQTLVAESARGVDGLINYHPVFVLGRIALRTAIIDHIVGDKCVKQNLLATALDRMRAQGVDVAVTSTLSGATSTDLLRAGFVPVYPGYKLLYICERPMPQLKHIRRLRVHLR